MSNDSATAAGFLFLLCAFLIALVSVSSPKEIAIDGKSCVIHKDKVYCER